MLLELIPLQEPPELEFLVQGVRDVPDLRLHFCSVLRLCDLHSSRTTSYGEVWCWPGESQSRS